MLALFTRADRGGRCVRLLHGKVSRRQRAVRAPSQRARYVDRKVPRSAGGAVRYQGGKSKLTSWIVDAIRADMGGRTVSEIVEPFIGGGAVTLALRRAFPTASIYATDAMPGLAEMHAAVVQGWTLGDATPEDHAEVTRRFRAGGVCTSPRDVALLTACSWGGKPGAGLARPWYPPPITYRRGYGTLAAFASWCATWRAAFDGTRYNFETLDYREALQRVREGALVYLDPPYAGTEAYPQAPRFDSAELWRHARACAARGAHVYVSELTAPEGGVRIVAERTRVRQMNKANPVNLVERLYAVNP
ncbi:MAG: hypothetical protein E6Q97_02895 [Desulfurellales bacterium]|nr:MAG: hypothetical protein E6Q97_02895 [Desulfurellales bacterium]